MSDLGANPSTLSVPPNPHHYRSDSASVVPEHDRHGSRSTKPAANLRTLEDKALNLRLDIIETQEVICYDERYRGQQWIAEFTNIVFELYDIYTNVRQLSRAMGTKPHCYSDEFKQDLDKNCEELGMTLDEIQECHDMLEKARSDNLVPWFFKKGRVDRLVKHLSVMRTQLKIMNIVIDNASREPGNGEAATPMSEHRSILEAALMTNERTIRAIHTEARSNSEEQSSGVSASATTEQAEHLSDTAQNVGQQSALPTIQEHNNGPDEVAPTSRRSTARFRESRLPYMPNMGITNQFLRARWIRPEARNDETGDTFPYHPYRRIPTTFDEILNPNLPLSSSSIDTPAGQPATGVLHSTAAARPTMQHQEVEEGAKKTVGRRLSVRVKEKVENVAAGVRRAVSLRSVLGNKKEKKKNERT